MQCKSVCTGEVRPYCSLGIDDRGEERCLNCYGFFTKKAIEKHLKARFGNYWGKELFKLKSMKKDIKGVNRGLRKKGLPIAEVIYFDTPPEGLEGHKDHFIWPQLEVDIQKAEEEYPRSLAGKVIIITSYGSHDT
jgi:hypothetical protein